VTNCVCTESVCTLFNLSDERAVQNQSPTRHMLQVPRFAPPAYCSNDTVMQQLAAEHTKPLQYRAHPCNFLKAPPALPEWNAPLWDAISRRKQQACI
jgi:hypothetical protein